MADNSNTVTITFQVKEDGSIVVVGQKAKGAVDDLNKSVGESKGPLDALQSGWVVATAKLAAATAVIYGGINAVKSFVSEATEAEQIQHRLAYAVESSGNAWGYYKKQTDAWANSIMKATRFTDEEARQSLAQMLMYTNDMTKAEKGAQLAMDMSVRTGQDLYSTTRMIGMVLTGNVEIVGRWVPQLRNLNAVLGENASMDEKSAFGLKEMIKLFSGTAAADVSTYAGKVQQFSNSWRELKESIGSEALPVLSKALEVMKEMADAARAAKEGKGAFGLQQQVYGMGINPETGLPFVAPGFTTVPKGYPTESERRFAGWGSNAPKEVLDPFVAKYGMTESEEKSRREYSQLMAEAFKEEKGWTGPKAEEEEMRQQKLNLLIEEYARVEQGMIPTEQTALELRKKKEEFDDAALEGILKLNDAGLAIYSEGPRNLVEGAQQLYDVTKQINDQEWIRLGITQEEYDQIVKNVAENKNWIKDWVQAYSETPNSIHDVMRLDSTWQQFGTNLSNVWSQATSNMISGSQTLGDVVKKTFMGIADSVYSSIMKMIANWILFENVTGTYKVGSGLIGWVGGLFGGPTGTPAVGIEAATGFEGMVTQPTFFKTREGGEDEYVSITPKSKMGQGAGQPIIINNNTYYIETTDLEAYERKYVPKVIGAMSKPRYADAMRNMIRRRG